MDQNSAEAKHLLAFIERIERLEEEKKQIAEDIKDVYAEAKGTGYDAKTLRKIVAIRKMDADKRREEEELLDLYLGALGMLADTPLGQAAVVRDIPSTKGKATKAAFEKQRDEHLAADVERRRQEAEKAEAKRKKTQDALRVGYLEDARKAGFEAYDGEEWSAPEALASDEEALKAHREGWDGAAEQAAKFGVPPRRRPSDDQPSATA